MTSEPDDLGGDPACWLDRVCEACGALIEDDDHTCPAAPDPPGSVPAR